MKKYFAKRNAAVTTIHGRFDFVEGLEVPEVFAKKFPLFVSVVYCDDEKVEVNDLNIEDLMKESKRKRKE